VYNASSKYASIIPNHPIEDVQLSNVRIYYQGGSTKALTDAEPPEKESAYPEPESFGETPSYGFFIRHVQGLQMNDVQVSYIKADARPAFFLSNVGSTADEPAAP
jgi:hypothetical protein